MDQLKKIKEDITVNQLFNSLTQAYQEHAVEQINLARNSVISSRQFSEQLAEVFSNVKAAYKHYIALANKKTKQHFPTQILPKNAKEIMVLITANNRLYGDLITRICKTFLHTANASGADVAVVGRLGRQFLEKSGFQRQYLYFELPDAQFSLQSIRPLVVQLLAYEKVTVFYGKFDNLVSQTPVAINISGDIAPGQNAQAHYDFLFDPSIEEIMEFFESQIFYLLFHQTLEETKLARFGARINAMENAQRVIEKQLAGLFRQEKRLKAIEMDKKQLQQFAGRSLWQKR